VRHADHRRVHTHHPPSSATHTKPPFSAARNKVRHFGLSSIPTQPAIRCLGLAYISVAMRAYRLRTDPFTWSITYPFQRVILPITPRDFCRKGDMEMTPRISLLTPHTHPSPSHSSFSRSSLFPPHILLQHEAGHPLQPRRNCILHCRHHSRSYMAADCADRWESGS
jgi:hypothetical protein